MAVNTVINTNVMSLNAHRNLTNVGNAQFKANQRLASGKKINSAADDAAGLAISSKMKSTIRNIDMASKNAEDGISMVQTAEGAMNEISEMVTRMGELAVQAANDTNSYSDRTKIQLEVDQLMSEIDSIAERTTFNGEKVLDGSFSGKIIHIGAVSDVCLTITVTSMSTTAIFGSSTLSLTTQSEANSAINTISVALEYVAVARAELGAIQNRLESTVRNLDITSENLSAANSRIEDADMAEEMMKLTSANVLQQAATSMLAQANQAPNSVTQLLG